MIDIDKRIDEIEIIVEFIEKKTNEYEKDGFMGNEVIDKLRKEAISLMREEMELIKKKEKNRKK